MTFAQFHTGASFVIIGAAGLATAWSDISERKIRNQDLITFGLAGLLNHAWFYTSLGTLPWPLILNISAATAASFLLFTSKIWRPGDAKLFVLYALLMPTTGYEKLFPAPCLTLFINAFLSALIFLIPAALKSIVRYRAEISKKLFSLKTLENLSYSFFLVSILSWTVFPLLDMIKIPKNNPFALCLIFIVYRIFYCFNPKAGKFRKLICSLALFGLIIRAIVFPDQLNAVSLAHFLSTMAPITLISQALNDLADHMKANKDRVPFAPFLLGGCLLSYTPFLHLVMQLVRR